MVDGPGLFSFPSLFFFFSAFWVFGLLNLFLGLLALPFKLVRLFIFGLWSQRPIRFLTWLSHSQEENTFSLPPSININVFNFAASIDSQQYG